MARTAAIPLGDSGLSIGGARQRRNEQIVERKQPHQTARIADDRHASYGMQAHSLHDLPHVFRVVFDDGRRGHDVTDEQPERIDFPGENRQYDIPIG